MISLQLKRTASLKLFSPMSKKSAQRIRVSLYHSSRSLPTTPISIPVSQPELSNGKLTQRNLEIATRALDRDGLVVLQDLVPHPILDKLNGKMVKDAYSLQARKEDSPYNYNRGNIQQDPPLTPEYFSDEIFLNPIVTQVTTTTLGPTPHLRFTSGNTALPPTPTTPPARQPVHADSDFDHPSLPFALVVNVPLVPMTPENGSTEVWLGTHRSTRLSDQEGAHGDRASGRIRDTLVEERKGVRPPCQPVVKKGSVIIRDLRLWHAGMPNLSPEPRVMLALIHFAPWYRNQMTIEVSSALRSRLSPERTGLDVAAKYLSSEELEGTYLNRPFGNAYDFDQVDKIEGIF